MKNKMAYAGSAMALMFGAGFLAPVGVYADGTISTFEELDSAICAGGSYTLGADIAANDWLGSQCNYTPSKDLTLDFNGYTITSAEDKGYNLDFYDGTLTFKDSVGGGGYTQLGSGNIAIAITNGKFVLDGGDINSVDWGVVLWHDSEMEMNGGSITTDTDACISGNGTTNPSDSNYGANTKITINGGKITSKNATGIYHPQMNGVLAITGGEISGKDTGVEIRAGELNITGGKISSASDVEYSVTANGSGSTISGAAVAVSQHTTKLPLKVVISGGEFSGPVAFSEQNPQQNGAEALAKITTSITNGSFVATGDEPIVVSEDVRNFITGGTYSKAPVDDYVAEGYKAIKTEEDYVVSPLVTSIELGVGEEVIELMSNEFQAMRIAYTPTDAAVDFEVSTNNSAIFAENSLRIEYDGTVPGLLFAAADSGSGEAVVTVTEKNSGVSASVKVKVTEVLKSDSGIAEDGTTVYTYFETPIEGENLAVEFSGEELSDAEKAKISPYLKAVYDISVVNQDTDEVVPVSNNRIDVMLVLNPDDYEGMKYFKVVYINENGELAETFDTEVQTDEDGNISALLFTTTHLSAYGVLASATEFPEVLAPDTGIGELMEAGSSYDYCGLVSAVIALTVIMVAMEIALWKHRQTRK